MINNVNVAEISFCHFYTFHKIVIIDWHDFYIGKRDNKFTLAAF